jgi:tetratricopeptide (TPR) repeat protein
MMMMMTKKNPQPLFLSCLLLASAQAAQGQIAPSAVSQQYTIHEDLLKCYHSIGKAAEEEAEYKWLLAARPSNALLHYNYAVLLKTAGKYPAASVQYEKAAQYEGSNVDYVGQCGQIFFYTKNYQKAYQYLGKAMQMPGGEKYKSSFDQVREYLQNIQLEIQRKQMMTPGGGKKGGPTLGPKKNDDDDD